MVSCHPNIPVGAAHLLVSADKNQGVVVPWVRWSDRLWLRGCAWHCRHHGDCADASAAGDETCAVASHMSCLLLRTHRRGPTQSAEAAILLGAGRCRRQLDVLLHLEPVLGLPDSPGELLYESCVDDASTVWAISSIDLQSATLSHVLESLSAEQNCCCACSQAA